MADLLDKTRGMFLGVAIGDSLGMAVETFSAERIAKDYGRVTTYLKPDGHKWFDGHPAGMTTDDTQLTRVVAEALIDGHKADNMLDMQRMAEYHIAAFKQSTMGWGRTSREAVRSMANGKPWNQSGSLEGAGNGVAMKIAPVALAALSPSLWEGNDVFDIHGFVHKLCIMTHNNSITVAATLAQFAAAHYCTKEDNQELPISFEDYVIGMAASAYDYMPKEKNATDNIIERLKLLPKAKEYTTEQIIKEFGAGSCYCYDSIPFSLMFFARNPDSIETLYDVISAGGDADTNGSMVGSLLGLKHGAGMFPEQLVSDLPCRDDMLDLADRFYNTILV